MTEDQAHYKKVIDDVQALFEAKREEAAIWQAAYETEKGFREQEKQELEAKVGKPWVGLTEEDIEAAMPGGIYDCLADPWDCGVGDGDYMRSIKNDVVRIVRAIEAKLKEKNT